MAGCRVSADDMEWGVATCEDYAKRFGGTWCVVSVDDGFDFVVRVVRECETIGDEFEAFEGRVLYVSGECG
jgi:hypothetical protein